MGKISIWGTNLNDFTSSDIKHTDFADTSFFLALTASMFIGVHVDVSVLLYFTIVILKLNMIHVYVWSYGFD